MVVFALPLVLAFIVLTVAAFTLGVKRLVGIRFSSFRTLLAGLLAYFLASPIITAVGGSAVARHHPLLPGLWFVMLGVACALVVGMVFLVVAEALVPSGSLPGPLYWFRGLRRRLARTRRYASITVLIFRYGLGPYLRGARRSELATPEGRTRLARSMALAMEEAGVTFVKLGQVLSTRRDLLPSEFVEELGRLQDQAAPLPWWEIDRVLRAELGSDPDDVFAELDRTPIASASVAQVHAAHLHSGEEVVVKVRRPGVGPVVDRDLDILGRLARSLERSTRWARSVGAITLAEGFAQALHEELDLRVEAANMASVAAGASHWPSPLDVTFPEPHESLCSSGVLVMSRLRGVPLAAAGMAIARRGLDSQKLAHNLLECLLRQIMLEGVF
ncbi:MAG: AarF/ABC1/UbiB kinase family protein, partial [Acidimicrobiales bacterium]|nr:AarF/ABC1/UbiB kinase family protein [Acidimicrobiales bacterium]